MVEFMDALSSWAIHCIQPLSPTNGSTLTGDARIIEHIFINSGLLGFFLSFHLETSVHCFFSRCSHTLADKRIPKEALGLMELH